MIRVRRQTPNFTLITKGEKISKWEPAPFTPPALIWRKSITSSIFVTRAIPPPAEKINNYFTVTPIPVLPDACFLINRHGSIIINECEHSEHTHMLSKLLILKHTMCHFPYSQSVRSSQVEHGGLLLFTALEKQMNKAVQSRNRKKCIRCNLIWDSYIRPLSFFLLFPPF